MKTRNMGCDANRSLGMVIVVASMVLSIAILGIEAQPAEGYYLLTAAAKTKGAVCLDGTPGAYYVIPGSGDGVDKWIVHFEGGAWCATDVDCGLRSLTALGSSKFNVFYDYDGNGIFNRSASRNPDFHNWNIVIGRYCDGASLTGNLDQPVSVTVTVPETNETRVLTIYLRGQRIWEALMEDLISRHGMANASMAVLTGCSAGGLTAILHCDQFSEYFEKNKTTVKCAPDGGFFMDVEDIWGGHTAATLFEDTVALHNSTLNSDCISMQAPSESWKCVFSQFLLPYIKTPIYFIQAAYDFWQIENTYVSNANQEKQAWASCLSDLHNCTPTQIQNLTTGFRDKMVENLNTTILQRNQGGNFLIACYGHCLTYTDYAWFDIKINNISMAQAVGDFVWDRHAMNVSLYINEDGPFPSNPTCLGTEIH